MSKLKRKYLIILVLLAVLILAGLIYWQEKANLYKKVLAEKEALLILDFGQGKERWFIGEVIEGMTVLDALKTSSQAGNFDFQVNSQIETINGYSTNNQKQWQCYLNGEKIDGDLRQKIINPKDKILCKYK
jgi:hypothetical protein